MVATETDEHPIATPDDATFQLLPSGRPVPADETPGRTFQVDACFASGGAWSGASNLIEAAYLGLLAIGRTDTVTRHDYELYMALPCFRDRIHPRYLCLTDTATGIERTRFYPMERSHRLVHGLVSLVLEWKQALGDRRRWLVIAGNFAAAQDLTARFFIELARRGWPDIGVIIQTSMHAPNLDALMPGMELLPAAVGPNAWRIAKMDDTSAMAAKQVVADDGDAGLEAHFPALLQYYVCSNDDDAAAVLAFKVLAVYNRRGYYHEAKSLLPTIIPHFDRLVGADQAKRMTWVGEINSCLVASGDGEKAREMVVAYAVPHITEPALLANLNYILAMHHVRYLEAKDTELAEHYLLSARENLREIAQNPAASERTFLRAFIDNGLAFVRVRQKRHLEALALCEAAYQSVTRELGQDRHLLHRSVLQFNMAQVQVMLGNAEEGLACYRKAIDMDPFYAEYHAEAGLILEQLGRPSEALDCYNTALEYSPPYPGVYLRKAICHSLLGEWQDALTYSGICLDLKPDQPELYAARAEVFVELGQVDAALAEYDRGIAISGDAIAMRVNRAVLHFSAGALDLALADMSTVIACEPGNPAHYENRAAIYQATDSQELYERDLRLAELWAESA